MLKLPQKGSCPLKSLSLKGSQLNWETGMNEEPRNELSDLDPSLSRRRLFIKAWLMSIGALGGSGLMNAFINHGLAEGSQDWVHRVQRSGDSPTMGELMNILRGQPGGADAIEKARRGGAYIPGANQPLPGVGKGPEIVPAPKFSVKFSSGHLKEGENLMKFQEVSILEDGTIRLIKKVDGGTITPSGFSTHSSPAVFVHLKFPADGWYLFNLRGVINAYWQVSSTLNWDPTFPGQPPIQTWTYGKSRQPGIRSFPAVFWYSQKDSPPRLRFTLSETYLDFLDATISWIPYAAQPQK